MIYIEREVSPYGVFIFPFPQYTYSIYIFSIVFYTCLALSLLAQVTNTIGEINRSVIGLNTVIGHVSLYNARYTLAVCEHRRR